MPNVKRDLKRPAQQLRCKSCRTWSQRDGATVELAEAGGRHRKKVKFMKTGKRDAAPCECVVEHPKDPDCGSGHADVRATRDQNLPHAAGRLSRAARSGREMTWKTWQLCLRAWMCLKPGCEHGPDDRRADGFDQTRESNTDDQLARIRVNGACSLLDGGGSC